MKPSYATIILLVMAFLTSCASKTENFDVVKTFELSEFDKPISSFLVLGTGKDPSINLTFETLLVTALTQQGVKAHSATKNLDEGVAMSESTARKLVEKLNVDAVLVTRLVATRIETETNEKRTELIVEKADDNLSDFLMAEYKVAHTESTVVKLGTALLATDLYTIKEGERVWSVESTSVTKPNAAQILADSVSKIVKQLRQDGIL